MANAQEYLEKSLKKLRCDYVIRDGKLIVSQEFQKDREVSDGVMSPFWVSEYGYVASLCPALQELSDKCDDKFGVYFECEYPQTFSILLEA